MFSYYTGQFVTVDGVWLMQPVPFSVACLMNGYSGDQVRTNLLEQIAVASTQVRDPFDLGAVAEKQAYWRRWLLSPWLPLTARTNCLNSSLTMNFPFFVISPIINLA